MQITMTERYRDWIDDLKDGVGRARIQMRMTAWHIATPGSIAILRVAYRS